MSFIKKVNNNVGKSVILTERKDALIGYFEEGSIVKIVDEDPIRGYSFEDDEGNRIIEAGWGGFEEIE